MSCPVGDARHSGTSTFLPQPLHRLRASNHRDAIGECPTRGNCWESQTSSKSDGLNRIWRGRSKSGVEGLRLAANYHGRPAFVEAIESSVLPVVSGGVVRAGGPRWRRGRLGHQCATSCGNTTGCSDTRRPSTSPSGWTRPDRGTAAHHEEMPTRNEADAIRQFLLRAKAEQTVSPDQNVPREKCWTALSSRFRGELRQLDDVLKSLRTSQDSNSFLSTSTCSIGRSTSPKRNSR